MEEVPHVDIANAIPSNVSQFEHVQILKACPLFESAYFYFITFAHSFLSMLHVRLICLWQIYRYSNF